MQTSGDNRTGFHINYVIFLLVTGGYFFFLSQLKRVSNSMLPLEKQFLVAVDK